jgi:AraC-like DNA-binding protein
MNTGIISIWSGKSTTAFNTIILPDGCRDLIVKIKDGYAPEWYVSPLFDQAKNIQIEANTSTLGFRLKPGIRIAEDELIASITDNKLDIKALENTLNEFTHLNTSVEEALQCLASDVVSVQQAALMLGVSTRTLQRFVLQETAKSPSYWFQLARVRKAARSLTQALPLIEVADRYGFSDQSHMCREFKRWFHTSPSELIKSPEIADQLTATGYGFE